MDLRILALSLLAATFAMAGCAHVAPYQRASLAHPSMDVSAEEDLEAFEAHLRESREGSTYGGSAGGGCGCN